jgi:co-chaperonin GroES (HSP10)
MENAQKIDMKSSEFQPKNKFILVDPVPLEKGEETSESGIVIAIKQNASVFDRPTIGKVIATGADVSDMNVGDTIVWPKTDGIDLAFDDGEFILLRDESVIGFKKS